MIKQSELSAVIDSQNERLMTSDFGLERDLLKKLPEKQENHALIISGIRRCGKSTLLGQLIKKVPSHVFFINFDTPKLYNFEISDFKIGYAQRRVDLCLGIDTPIKNAIAGIFSATCGVDVAQNIANRIHGPVSIVIR